LVKLVRASDFHGHPIQGESSTSPSPLITKNPKLSASADKPSIVVQSVPMDHRHNLN